MLFFMVYGVLFIVIMTSLKTKYPSHKHFIALAPQNFIYVKKRKVNEKAENKFSLKNRLNISTWHFVPLLYKTYFLARL